MTLDDWREWCKTELRFEQEFACVWLGLGIWQAVLDGDGEAFVPPRSLPEDGIALQIAGFSGRGMRIPWRFPTAEARLRAFAPSSWLAAVLHADRSHCASEVWRIKLIDEACLGPQRQWRLPLVRIGLRLAAVSADAGTHGGPLRLGWPLRVGYFSDNKPPACFDSLAEDLTRCQALGRDHDLRDLLVFWGTAAELCERVRADAGHITATLLWLISPAIPSPATLDKLYHLTGASGLVVMEPDAAADKTDLAINGFVEEFWRGRSCDIALELGVEKRQRITVVQLSERLAHARLGNQGGMPARAPQPPPSLLARSIQLFERLGKGRRSSR